MSLTLPDSYGYVVLSCVVGPVVATSFMAAVSEQTIVVAR